MHRTWVAAAFMLTGYGLAALLSSDILAQGSGSSRTDSAPNSGASSPAAPEEFHAKLWRFLVNPKSPYTKWPRFPGRADLAAAAPPHGPVARLYSYKYDLAHPDEFPSGTVLVLENYETDKQKRTSIDVMYRFKGYDATAGDWYWMRYTPSGTVALSSPETGRKPLAGKLKACSQCHAQAAGSDFVFSNDEPGKKEEPTANSPKPPANPNIPRSSAE